MPSKTVHKTERRTIFFAGQPEGRMCGHQHDSPRAAANCGQGKLPVVMATYSRPDKMTGERVVTFDVLEPTPRGTYKRTGMTTW